MARPTIALPITLQAPEVLRTEQWPEPQGWMTSRCARDTAEACVEVTLLPSPCCSWGSIPGCPHVFALISQAELHNLHLWHSLLSLTVPRKLPWVNLRINPLSESPAPWPLTPSPSYQNTGGNISISLVSLTVCSRGSLSRTGPYVA